MNLHQVTYLLEQQKNQQWDFFLQPFAEIFTEKLTSEDLHSLMHSIGIEASKKISIEGVNTLNELEIVLNEYWKDIKWGVIVLKEINDSLHVAHYYPPLIFTFEEKDYAWITGFLEGVYQGVFQRLGAGSSLKVVWLETENKDCLEFKLSS